MALNTRRVWHRCMPQFGLIYKHEHSGGEGRIVPIQMHSIPLQFVESIDLACLQNQCETSRDMICALRHCVRAAKRGAKVMLLPWKKPKLISTAQT